MGIRLHQDIQPMEKRIQGRWVSAMIEDYLWFLIRKDTSGRINENIVEHVIFEVLILLNEDVLLFVGSVV